MFDMCSAMTGKQVDKNLDKISLDGTIGESTYYTIIFKISVKQNQNKSV